MYWAMSELPTKPTAWMSGWCRIASTASLSPCTTWNTPGGRPGLSEQFGEPHRHGRVALTWLEYERISTGEGGTGLPQRDHCREVERGDARDHAQRLAPGVGVGARAGALAVFDLEEVGVAEAELDDLDAALDVAPRVGHGLAVLDGQQLGQLVAV